MSGVKISFITSLYRGSAYLENFFESVAKIQENIEIILIHNEPLPEELLIVEKYLNRNIFIKHIVVPREGVYASWNRGILEATGKYIAMWNVDDVRTKEGVIAQAALLDTKPDVHIVSGDYTKIFRLNALKGVLKKDPVNRRFGIYKFNNGCFLMWRKTIHNEIGYFDEQFMVAGDWEFWMRATQYFQPARTEVMLGYYLREANTGLSKKRFVNESVEEYVIRTRFYKYYIANILKYLFVGRDKIKVNYIVNFKRLHSLERKVPFNLISKLASVLFFWTVPLLKQVIEFRYRILQKGIEQRQFS